MSTVNQHRKLDTLWTSVIHERIHGGADGTSGEEHVIYKGNFFPLQGEWNIGPAHRMVRKLSTDIIAIKGDINRSHRYGSPLDNADLLSNTFGQERSTGADTDQN